MPEREERPAPAAAERVRDRKLGDEWADWNGRPEEAAALDEDRRVFVGYAFLCLVAMVLAALLTVYMIYPRLEGWSGWLARAVAVLLAGGSLAVIAWFAAIVLPLLTALRFTWRPALVPRTLNLLVPLTIRLGGKFGVSRDRISNSFIKVSNALVRGARVNTGSGPLLVLLPRCLAPQVRQAIQALAERYGAPVFTVPGGELARQLIRDHRPSRIIAVACERDLVSGLHDVAPVIPTYAVPNCRPEGPCKNTTVELRLIEEALILFNPREERSHRE